ncbi:alpha/beta hydrolase [Acidiferrimicrobium sp. IK]|uniref:alpha/beta fold hydrolase n=1 Tax=Acidiferrimicrobium sp. IK TaxID=2871700 RepID=UPI0021CB9164|nr:alpha/beta hydrolase [Acidiferrimicrobium sp. IK]MCU4183312.1 alpha/beta hydrolase [Acidiferrimicrobium sp. IK]
MSQRPSAGNAKEGDLYPDLAALGVPEGRFVELPGRGRTFVREIPGPPGAPVLILLHGLSATGGTNWAGAFGALGDRYRVIALDHRGHGQGIRCAHFRLADCADDVVALADVLGIDQFIPVGYSMGGPIAQLVWHRHRSRVSAMVLCATSRDFRGRLDDRLLFLGVGTLNLGLHGVPRPLRMKGWQAVARAMAGGFATRELRRWSAVELSRHDPRLVCEAALAVGSFSSRGWIDGVDVPVAVIATEHDQLVPLRRQIKLADHIPSAVLHPVSGDHFAVTRQADQFIAALSESCDEVIGRGARWRMSTVATGDGEDDGGLAETA